MRPVFFLALLLLTTSCFPADLPRSTPEAQGVSSRELLAFLEAADKLDAMHSVMVLRHGSVIAEGWWTPYSAQTPHVLWSLSKSFTSTAIGMAVAEHKISIDDEVLKFFPDDAPAQPSANLKSMRVSDLLRMSTGHQTEPKRVPAEAWTTTFLNHPVPNKPGTHFLYNSMGTYMLSAIVQKTTGQTANDFLTQRLYEPLGIEKPVWDSSPQGINCGGWGLHLRTEDIARFGQLYLQKGKWQGRQLVPEAWVDAATARQASNGSSPKSDWDQGYGYQFWRCRHNAYRGDGAYGQYCVVMPDQDAVLVITSGVKNMQSVLDVAWDKLLPAFKPAALPADDEAAKQLAQRTKNLSIRTQEGSAQPAKVFGKKYVFPANERKLESLTLEETKDAAATLVMKIDGVEQRIPCGHNAWINGKAAWGIFKLQPEAASGAWTADDTFTAKIVFYETAQTLTLPLKFTGNELNVNGELNVNMGPIKDPPLAGKAE